jgi:hypothetical protein
MCAKSADFEQDDLEALRQRHYESLAAFLTDKLGMKVMPPTNEDILTAGCVEAMNWLREGAPGKALETLESALKRTRA